MVINHYLAKTMDFTRASRTQNLIGAYLHTYLTVFCLFHFNIISKFWKRQMDFLGAALSISICLISLSFSFLLWFISHLWKNNRKLNIKKDQVFNETIVHIRWIFNKTYTIIKTILLHCAGYHHQQRVVFPVYVANLYCSFLTFIIHIMQLVMYVFTCIWWHKRHCGKFGS